jgi:predicted nucleotidyltransferase
MQAYQKDERVKHSIIIALGYFHIFRFPLYFEEIFKYMNTPVTEFELLHELQEMEFTGEIFRHKNLYMLENDPEIADNRIKCSFKAVARLEEARRSGNIISKFPFVKAVCISGSLSKGYADDQSDIDFFIITSENRLWLCRTLLHLFKKLTFLNGTQHSYCMNYFLDESRLCIEEQNAFTGTEIVTLIPVYSEGVFNSFMHTNYSWVGNYFPNFILQEQHEDVKKALPKTIAETILNLLFAGYLNKGLLQLTDKWWRFKWQRKDYPMEDYDLAMKTRWYVSKNHPANYQKRVLQRLKLQFNA